MSRNRSKLCPECGLPFEKPSHFASLRHIQIKAFVQAQIAQALVPGALEKIEIKDLGDLEKEVAALREENSLLRQEITDLKGKIRVACTSLGAEPPDLKQISMEERFKDQFPKNHLKYQKKWGSFVSFCRERNQRESPQQVMPYLEFLATIKGRKSTTIQRAAGYLKTCFRLQGLTLKIGSAAHLGEIKKEKYLLRPEEIKKHLEWVRETHGQEMGIFQRILYESGARFFAAKNIRVRDIWENSIVPMETKTQKKKVPISAALSKEIHGLIAQKDLKSEERVFSDKISAHRVKASLLRSPELSGKDKRLAFGPHCFRTTMYNRTYSKAMDKASLKAARKLGHTNLSTGKKYYLSRQNDHGALEPVKNL
jgi:Phage integrase family